MIRAFLIGVASVLLLSGAPSAQALLATAPVNAERAVDEIFSRWAASTPGCAVGVAVGGKPVLLKAYGMADFEHDVRNTPETIFESGSVAKQFTALAVVASVENSDLVLKRRPDSVIKLTATGPDKCHGSIGTVTFIRNASGAVDALSID